MEGTNTTATRRQPVPADSPILIVSNEAWNGPRYSKHRFALALRPLREVFFIDPAMQWRPSHLFRTQVRSQTTPEGITVLSYDNAIPLFGGLLGSINDRIVSRRLRAYLRRAGKGAPLLWTFDPSRLVDPRQLDAAASVYHCADDHGYRLKGERLLGERCDHVFCIARDLMLRFTELNPSVHHVPHGLSEEDMQVRPVDPAQLPAPPGYGLYIGNINDRHDFALWEEVVRRNPDVTWVAAGPINVTDPTGLRLIEGKALPNVRFLGPVPYDELRGLITGAGFGFLYMRQDHPANRISSQKVVQFLAQGKPFFCSWFSEYEDRQGLVYMTDGHEEALEAFARWRAHGEPADAVRKRLDLAQDLLFHRLIAQLPFAW